MVLDAEHSSLVGDDPVLLAKKHRNRVKHVHLKDLRKRVLDQFKKEEWSFLKGVKNGLFTVPGDGDIVDWEGLFGVLTD